MAGHSLLLSLSKRSHPYSKITLYDAPAFCPPCSLNSTAIVAARGISEGHSDLGNLLMAGFKTFSAHVESDSPAGVVRVPQYTGTKTKLDQFRTRYPESILTLKAGGINLTDEHLLAEEDAFEITPTLYLAWIRAQVQKKLPLEIKSEFFKNDESFDDIVFCGGIANKFWKPEIKSKSVQGSYLEFSNVNFKQPSFSMTLDGQNLIYQHELQTLLIGSTTQESIHYLPPMNDLKVIYESLFNAVDLPLPPFQNAIVKTGLREKAPKRLPYIHHSENQSFIGGFYKNGFSLSLEMSNRWCEYRLKV